MSLNVPELDDLEYSDIIEDARQRIPVYSKVWTDHNASDPGITILELFAWLAETYSYQLDQITDAHRRKYLALLGEKPRPPQPASIALQMCLPQGTSTAIVPESTKLVATDENSVSYGFETTAETTLTAARLERVIVDGQQGRLDYSTTNETPGVHYPAFGEAATRDSKLYLGFDKDPFFGTSTLSLAIRFHEEGLPDPATHGEAADSWTERIEFKPSAVVEWQQCVANEWHPLDVTDDGTNAFYQSGRIDLRLPSEEQQAEKENGEELSHEIFGGNAYQWIRCVVKEGEYEIVPQLDRVAVNVVPAEHRWTVEDQGGEPLRTTDRGVSSLDETRSTGLPNQSFRFTLSDPDLDLEERSVETPRRTFNFVRTPILNIPDVDRSSSDEGAIDISTWERREDFDNSGPHDEHYVLDQTSGTVRFGDGTRGKIPPEGVRITATKHVGGGSTRGNIPSSVTWTFEGTLFRPRNWKAKMQKSDQVEPTVVQLEAATGGTDAESIDEAFDRLIADRRVPYRAVSLADYEYLATNTPGLRFGRAAARVVEHDPVRKHRPGRDDEVSCRYETETNRRTTAQRETSGTLESPIGKETGEDEPNVTGSERDTPESADDQASNDYCEPQREVRVVVVPYSRSSRPTPSEGFLDTVERHLELHRLLTDWVTVEHPTYVDVGVDVEVSLEPGYAVPQREAAIKNALETFLDPLRGFKGDGWPFGRTLYRSELYEVIEDVTGVDCVTRLAIRSPDEDRINTKGNLVIEEAELLSPQDSTVTARVASSKTNGQGKCV